MRQQDYVPDVVTDRSLSPSQAFRGDHDKHRNYCPFSSLLLHALQRVTGLTGVSLACPPLWHYNSGHRRVLFAALAPAGLDVYQSAIEQECTDSGKDINNAKQLAESER